MCNTSTDNCLGAEVFRVFFSIVPRYDDRLSRFFGIVSFFRNHERNALFVGAFTI